MKKKYYNDFNFEEEKQVKKSISFKTAFLIVILLHLIVGVFFIIPPPKAKKTEQTKSVLASSKKSEEVATPQTKLDNTEATTPGKIEPKNPSVNNSVVKTTEAPTVPLKQVESKPTHVSSESRFKKDSEEELKKLWKTLNQSTENIITHSTPSLEETKDKIIEQLNEERKKHQEVINAVKQEFLNQQKLAYKPVEVVQLFDIPKTEEIKQYTLKSGDTLYGVSKKFNVSFQDLVEHNKINDVRELYAGQMLLIP